MENKIVLIAKRAKRIRKKGEAWQAALKRARTEVMRGASLSPSKKKARKVAPKKSRRAAAKKTVISQRVSSSVGRVRKPVEQVDSRAYNEMILSRVRSNQNAFALDQRMIATYKERLRLTPVKDKARRTALKNDIERYRKHAAAMKADTAMLKRLIA